LGKKTVPVIRPRVKKKQITPVQPSRSYNYGYRITSLLSKGLFFDLEMLGAFKGNYIIEIRVLDNNIDIMIFFNPGKRLLFKNRELKKGLEAIKTVFISQNTPETFHSDITNEDWNERVMFYKDISKSSIRAGTGIGRHLCSRILSNSYFTGKELMVLSKSYLTRERKYSMEESSKKNKFSTPV